MINNIKGIEDKNSVDKVKPARKVIIKSVESKNSGNGKVVVPQSDSLAKFDITPGRISETLKAKIFSHGLLKIISSFRACPGEQVFEPSVTEGCAPLRVIFKNKLAGIRFMPLDIRRWRLIQFGNPEWIYDVEGSTGLILMSMSGMGLNRPLLS